MSAQTKLRVWVVQKSSGEEFTTQDVRNFLKDQGFNPDQSGSLMSYMIYWWKLVVRAHHGRYRRL